MIYIIWVGLVIITVCYVAVAMKADFYKERYDETKKRLFREIDQLDDYIEENQSNTNTSASIKKVMIPDEVNIKEASLKSTQDEDCKEYTVSTNSRPIKAVIGKTNNSDINNVIENDDNNDEDDDPIKNL